MIFRETRLKGSFVIDLEPVADDRGFFARSWCQREFSEHGLNPGLVQANLAYNPIAGTLRGMHYQVRPHAEAKLVRCTRGRIFDVLIDLRRESPTFRDWVGEELAAENRRMLYVPEGFAHGYQTLEGDSEVFYLVSEYYAPGSERGVRWDDPAFAIRWPKSDGLVISEKDRGWPDFSL